MMTKLNRLKPARAAILVAALAGVAGIGVVAAQTAFAPKPVVATPANLLSLSDIEGRLSTHGIKVREVDVRDLVLEIEGHDADGREVELIVDRRNGEILSHRYDR